MSTRILRSSTRPLVTRLRGRDSTIKKTKVRRCLDSLIPDWRKHVEWSADRMQATCKLCSATLCNRNGSAFSFKRHLLGKHRFKQEALGKRESSIASKQEATSEKQSDVAHTKLKGAPSSKRNGRHSGFIPPALKKKKKKNKASQTGSCVRAEKVPKTSESGEDATETVNATAENGKSKSPADGERPKQDNRLVINTNSSSSGPFANSRPCKLTDEELVAACSFKWQLHGKRSLDGKWVTCEWCAEAFPILEGSPLEEFKEHLTNWHDMQFLNGWDESMVNELSPETNLALDGRYLFCNVCSSAIFITFADLEKHMNDHHGIY